MRPIEKLIEKRKEEFIRNNLMSDEFIDFIQKNKKPMDKLLSYYACAIMEVETKFRVLDHQYSLEYDRNPIEDIKSRVKSWESLIKKVRRKEIPLTLSSIEENIHDIAGVRVVCSFPDDIYMLADCLLNQDDITLIEKKDYIKNPKPGGPRPTRGAPFSAGRHRRQGPPVCRVTVGFMCLTRRIKRTRGPACAKAPLCACGLFRGTKPSARSQGSWPAPRA